MFLPIFRSRQTVYQFFARCWTNFWTRPCTGLTHFFAVQVQNRIGSDRFGRLRAAVPCVCVLWIDVCNLLSGSWAPGSLLHWADERRGAEPRGSQSVMALLGLPCFSLQKSFALSLRFENLLRRMWTNAAMPHHSLFLSRDRFTQNLSAFKQEVKAILVWVPLL